MKKLKENIINALRMGLLNMGFKLPKFIFDLPKTFVKPNQEKNKNYHKK